MIPRWELGALTLLLLAAWVTAAQPAPANLHLSNHYPPADISQYQLADQLCNDEIDIYAKYSMAWHRIDDLRLFYNYFNKKPLNQLQKA